MKKYRFLILISVVLSFLGCTCTSTTNDNQAIHSSEMGSISAKQKLNLTVSVGEETPFHLFSPADLGNAYEYTLEYYELNEVFITQNSKAVPLEQAVQNGEITIEELIAYTQIDARNGICTAASETELGLTMYSYEYPNYKVQIYNDVFETPDGRQHQISRFVLLNPKLSHPVSTSYIDWDSKFGYQLDREDWGITLELVEASPTDLTLHCSHAGGQHFGELRSTEYTLFTANGEPVLSPEGHAGGFYEDITIQQNAESTFTVSWEKSHGELSHGEYLLRLWFTDVYNETDLHPLTRNYRDNQPYVIPFAIP